MMYRDKPVLDMTPDGRFRTPPRPPASPMADRIALTAAVVTVAAGSLAFAAIAFWLVLMLVPVAIGAGAIAYGAWRYRSWRSGASSFGGQRNVLRR